MPDDSWNSSKTLVWLALFVLLFPPVAHSQQTIRIGMVIDGPGRFERGGQTIQQEVLSLTEGEFDVRFPPSKLLDGKWDLETINRSIDQLLQDPEVEIVITLGVLSSNALAQRRDLPKPAIAPYVINPSIQGLPQVDGASGIPNLSYVTYPHDFRRDFQAFQEIFPFDQMAILSDRLNITTIPELPDTVRRVVAEMGFQISLVPCDDLAAPALAAIPEEAEVVYVTPLIRFSEEEFDKLVQGFIDKGLPSFSLLGQNEVQRGILAGIAPATDPVRLARRVAVNIQRILLGEDAGTLPVVLHGGEQPSVNMATARALGVFPSWAFLTEAERFDEVRADVRRLLTIRQAVDEAVKANLDLAAAAREVDARGQEVREARSVLLPQINLLTDATVIDEDRARASLGSQPQRTWTGSAILDQVLFSEPAWANLSVSEHFRDATEESRQRLRLDITFESSTAYLDVLRAKTLERIQKDNLELSRENLGLAEVRVNVGFASPAEVYRWESAIATARADLINANAVRNQTEIALNRLLARPLEEPFLTQETGLEDTTFITSDPRFLRFFGDPLTFRTFRSFMVEQSFDYSPELRELNALIAAQNRVLSASKRAFWLPDFALQGGVTGLFAEGGAGTSQEAGAAIPTLPLPNDTDWFVGVRASIPLFTSGARAAVAGRAGEELARLQIQRAAVQDRIEAGIRQTLHQAGASYAGIGLARDAAVAADKNLNLVTDSYSRGAVSIITLLDAQNEALVANLAAANAIYDFLIDLMAVERQSGTYYFFASPEERERWFTRAETFVNNPPAGGPGP